MRNLAVYGLNSCSVAFGSTKTLDLLDLVQLLTVKHAVTGCVCKILSIFTSSWKMWTHISAEQEWKDSGYFANEVLSMNNIETMFYNFLIL